MKNKQQELVKLYYKNKSIELLEKISITFKPLVEYIARKLAYNIDDLDDLIQIGNIALIRCLDRYDINKNIDFATFVTPNIIGEIKHYFRDKNKLIKVPRRLQEVYAKIKTIVRDMQNDQKQPTLKVLAQKLDVSEELVLEAMEAGQNTRTISLDTPTYTHNQLSNQGNQNENIMNRLGVIGKEDSLLNKETLKEAIYKLTKRERRIVYLRYYGGLSQTQIADRLGLSQMHISRLLGKSILKLKTLIIESN
ncbi:MAG: sigma-70 family RNA polymerase sigma factor [bacterium]